MQAGAGAAQARRRRGAGAAHVAAEADGRVLRVPHRLGEAEDLLTLVDGKDVAQYEGALNAWHVELLDGAVALRPGRGKSGKREPTAATAVTGNGDGSGDGGLR